MSNKRTFDTPVKVHDFYDSHNHFDLTDEEQMEVFEAGENCIIKLLELTYFNPNRPDLHCIRRHVCTGPDCCNSDEEDGKYLDIFTANK